MFGLNPWPFLLALVVFGAGYGTAHHFDGKRYDKLAAEYNQFKGGAEAVGREAFKAAERQTANDIKRRNDTDAKHRARTAADSDTIARLRAERDSARSAGGGVVPASPAGSVCPEGLACYSREALESALRGFTSEIRGLADEGAKVERELGAAREWAREVNR